MRPPASVSSVTLENVEAAAFLLLHELGHRTKSFGDLDDDAGLAGAPNNDKIREACFSEAMVNTTTYIQR